MASKRHLRRKLEKGCVGKVRHATVSAALTARRKVGNAGLAAYLCKTCGGYHLGNRRGRVQMRIAQLLGNPS